MSENYWPQGKNADKRTSGAKLKVLYEKIAAKSTTAA